MTKAGRSAVAITVLTTLGIAAFTLPWTRMGYEALVWSTVGFVAAPLVLWWRGKEISRPKTNPSSRLKRKLYTVACGIAV